MITFAFPKVVLIRHSIRQHICLKEIGRAAGAGSQGSLKAPNGFRLRIRLLLVLPHACQNCEIHNSPLDDRPTDITACIMTDIKSTVGKVSWSST